MKYYLIIVTLLISVYSDPLFSADKKVSNSEKLVIYSFFNEKNSTEFKHLSDIIPRVISHELKQTPEIVVSIENSTIPSGDISSYKTEEAKNEYIMSLNKRADADYIITGSYFVDKGGINITSYLYFKSDNKLQKFTEYSAEKGASMVTITDEISKKLGDRITSYIRKKIREEKVYFDKFESKKYSLRPLVRREKTVIKLLTGGRDFQVNYVPNLLWKYGLNFTYSKMSLSLLSDTGLDDIQDDKERYGDSDSQELNFHYYMDFIGIELLVKRYRGFYIENSGSNYPGWTDGDPFVQFNDMVFYNSRLNIIYNLIGSKFSMRAAFSQSEIQQKSAGTMILDLGLSYKLINNNNSIIPPLHDSEFNSFSGLKELKVIGLDLKTGFTFCSVSSSFFITPAAFFGIGGQYMKYNTLQGDDSALDYNIFLAFKVVTGYNGRNFLAGLAFSINNNIFNSSDAIMEIYEIYGEVFAGTRF